MPDEQDEPWAGVFRPDKRADEMSPTNAQCVAWGQRVIDSHLHAVRGDKESALRDLLANLMHWVDSENAKAIAKGEEPTWDFEDELQSARSHYEEER